MNIIKVDSRGRISLKKLCKLLPSHFVVRTIFNEIVLTPINSEKEYNDPIISEKDSQQIKNFIEEFIKKAEEIHEV